MARPALATIDDLQARLGYALNGEAVFQALVRLEDASEIVRAYAGRTWLNDEEDDVVDVPQQITGVVASMVERATRNPAGITQETAGPFSHSFGAAATDRLYLTKAERMVIRASGGRGQIGTLATSRGPLETRSVWSGYPHGLGDTPEEDYVSLTNLMGGT